MFEGGQKTAYCWFLQTEDVLDSMKEGNSTFLQTSAENNYEPA